jgi:amidase
MKDVFGHEAGRRVEFGSRLCQGMVAQEDSVYCQLLRNVGFNLIGRSAAPEYSMAGTTETALYGNTSTPWRHGFSAGGSSGGAAAAVMSGMVPGAMGTDIAGSIRIPASFCGGVGLKPSRGRVANAYGLPDRAILYTCGPLTRSVDDAAAMLDVRRGGNQRAATSTRQRSPIKPTLAPMLPCGPAVGP